MATSRRLRPIRHLSSALGALLVIGVGVVATATEPVTIHSLAAMQVDPEVTPTEHSSWVVWPVDDASVRQAPDESAKRIGTVSPWTPYSQRESGFMASQAIRDLHGHVWVRIQVAQRPNRGPAWIPVDAVYFTTTEDKIVVHRSARRLEYWRAGRKIRTFPTGVGRPTTPSPLGRYAVEDIVPVAPGQRRAYGRYIVTITAHSEVLARFNGGDGQIAIHGTGTGGRVGVPSSHGCFVLGASALDWVRRHAKVGTPVIVLN